MFSWWIGFHTASTVQAMMSYIVVQIAPSLHPRSEGIKQRAMLTGQGVLVPVACDGFYRAKEDAYGVAQFMSESYPNLQTIVAEVVVSDRGDEVTSEYPPMPYPENEAPPPFIDPQRERAKMTPAIRYQVIKRDGYRCRACGASVQNGALLHVDHITAVSNGGKTVIDNLQTLCTVCNLGKGAQ